MNQMPPKKKKTSRRRDTAVSIPGLAEGLLLANVATTGLFNLSLKDWAMDGWTAGSTGLAAHPNQLSLYEMIYGNASQTSTIALPSMGGYGTGPTTQTVTLTPGSNTEVITQNARANIFPMVAQSIAIPVAFRVGKRFMRKPIRMGNKLLKQAGLRRMVKI